MQSVSQAAMAGQMRPMKPMDSGADAMMGPGKSGQSVGHQAKAAVAAAAEAGIDLPKNAQGVAASAIAQGTDPAMIFAAQVDEPVEDPVVDPVVDPGGDAVDDPVIDETGDMADVPMTTAPDGEDMEPAPVAAGDGSDPAPPVDEMALRDLAAATYSTATEVFAADATTSAENALDLLLGSEAETA